MINLRLSKMVKSLTQNRTIRSLVQLGMDVMMDSDWLEGPTTLNVIEMETGRSLMFSAMVGLYFSFIYSNKDLQNVLITDLLATVKRAWIERYLHMFLYERLDSVALELLLCTFEISAKCIKVSFDPMLLAIYHANSKRTMLQEARD